MTGLLQVALYDADRSYLATIETMVKALDGSEYALDEDQTVKNDMVAMIITKTESESLRLMEEGEVTLPNGSIMEIPAH